MSEGRTSDAQGAGTRFSPGAKRVLALQAARTGLSMSLDTIRQLLEAGGPRQRQTEEIREAGRSLDQTRRQRAEAAARLIEHEVGEIIAPVVSALAGSSLEIETAEGRWFPHPEELAVFAFDQLGPSTVSGVEDRLLGLCGNDYAVAEYAFLLFRWRYAPTPTEVLLTGLTTSVVRAFEELLAALFRTWHLAQSHSDEPDAGAASQLQAAALYATKMLKKGRRDWSAWFFLRLDLDLSEVVPGSWLLAREVFARRNVIEHDASRADRQYLDLLEDLDGLPALGDRLECGHAYVERAIASLEAVADTLTVGFGAHLAPTTAELAKLSEEPVYRALRAGRYLAARWMGERALAALDEGHDHNELLVNVWMARQELGDDTVRDEVRVWAPPADDVAFELAKAALLGDVPGARTTLQQWSATNPRDLRRISEWPIVRRLEERSEGFRTDLRLALSRATHISEAHARTWASRGRRRR